MSDKADAHNGRFVAIVRRMKKEISYDAFARMDIRIGTVTVAERVPETDNLIKCTVDFGSLGERIIVSGIAAWRAPDSLIGKQMPYIVNLKPRTIRGVASEGMLLAPGTDEGLAALLHPDEPVGAGTPIK